MNEFLDHAFAAGADAGWVLDRNGEAISGGVIFYPPPELRDAQTCMVPGVLGKQVRVLLSGIEIWEAGKFNYSAARIPIKDSQGGSGFLLTAYRSSPAFLERLNQIQAQTAQYYAEKQSLRALKRQMLLILLFFTMLVLFSVMWVALFLSKQVTVPIQALAEGTREISSGNFDYQVPDQVQDELGILARSFNNMTKQLRDNRAQIDQFTHNLQQAVQELERRRQLMETVLENIPTGVVSLDAAGAILRCNTAVNGMLGGNARGQQ